MIPRVFAILLAVVWCLLAGARTVQTSPHHGAPSKTALDHYHRLPLAFEENRGQAPEGVRFLARARDLTVLLTGTGARFAFSAGTSWAALQMTLAGARSTADVTGGEPLAGRANYFVGSDPARWRTDIPTFRRVRYGQVYPGIDVVYYSTEGGRLEYDLVVAPGADPRAIRLAFDGADSLTIDGAGDLVARVGNHEIRIARPRIFQESHGTRHAVGGRYVIDALSREVRFALASYDSTKPLVIDPIIYLAHFGGTSDDVGMSVAVDTFGNAYVTGVTPAMTNFPGPGVSSAGSIGPGGATDVFVAKINPGGSDLVYSTVIGGNSTDANVNSFVTAIAVDAAGQAYVTGRTSSTDFPTLASARYQDCSNTGTFVTKLNEPGSALVYSTCFNSGVKQSGGTGIALGLDASVYVAGYTDGNIDTKNGFQPQFGGNRDLFLARFDAKQTGADSLLYSTYIGGLNQEETFGPAVAVDGQGNAYVTGYTGSRPGPPPNGDNFVVTPGAYSTKCDNCNNAPENFVVKINPAVKDAGSLVYSTYTGVGFGSAGVAVDAEDNVYVTTGTNVIKLDATFSKALATANVGGGSIAVDTGGTRVFLPDGSLDLTTSTFDTFVNPLGPNIRRIAIDAACSVYRTGSLPAGNIATGPLGALEKGGGLDDAILEKWGPGSLAYIPNRGADSVSVIDTANNTIVGSPIAVGSQPLASAVTPDGKRVFVVNQTITAPAGSVWIIDTTTSPPGISKKLELAGRPEPRAVVIAAIPNAPMNQPKAKAYVANPDPSGKGKVTVIGADSAHPGTFENEIGSPLVLTGNPLSLAASADGKYVYVVTSGGLLYAIDTATDAPTPSSPIATQKATPAAVAVSPDGSRVFVGSTDAPGFLEIYTTNPLSLSKGPFQLSNVPVAIAAHPDGARVFVIQQVADGKNGLLVFNASTGSQIGQFDTGTFPSGVSAHPDGTRVFVANSGSNNVSVVDVETDLTPTTGIVATLTVGTQPFALSPFIKPEANPDADGDGIVDAIEKAFNPQTKTFDYVKDAFTNQHLCGRAFGSVVNRNGLQLKVENRAGLVVKATGGGGPAEIKLCGDPYSHFLSNGDVYAVPPCGSTTVSLKAGPPAQISLGPDTSLAVPAGATVRIMNSGPTPQIQNLGSEKAVDLLAFGQVVQTIAPNSVFSGELPALPQMGITDAMVDEGDTGLTNVLLTVVLSRAIPQAITVEYETIDGSAVAGGDYISVRGTLQFAPGETMKALTVQIVGDRIPEAQEAFFVDLTRSTNIPMVKARGTVTINDHDVPPAPVVDMTPPVVTVPANITADPTSIAGAVVRFTASALDETDGAVAVSCAPAPGSTFLIGTTTVYCTAVDRSDNLGYASFTVTVLSPLQITEDLIRQVGADGFQQANNLLQNTLKSLNNSNETAACNQLTAFMNQVQAARSLSTAEKTSLIEDATNAQLALGCRGVISITPGGGLSLQGAIDSAPAGGIIRLAPGNYTGGVAIVGKTVSLVGDDRSNTFITLPQPTEVALLNTSRGVIHFGTGGGATLMNMTIAGGDIGIAGVTDGRGMPSRVYVSNVALDGNGRGIAGAFDQLTLAALSIVNSLWHGVGQLCIKTSLNGGNIVMAPPQPGLNAWMMYIESCAALFELPPNVSLNQVTAKGAYGPAGFFGRMNLTVTDSTFSNGHTAAILMAEVSNAHVINTTVNGVMPGYFLYKGKTYDGIADGIIAGWKTHAWLTNVHVLNAPRAGIVFDSSAGKMVKTTAAGGQFGLVAQGSPKPDWSAPTNSFSGAQQAILTDGALPVPAAPPPPEP